MDMKLRMTSKAGSRETAQAAYDGARYYRTDSGIYLKDFGRGESDDSVKLYSGQMLDFDGVDDYVDCGANICNFSGDFTATSTIYLQSGETSAVIGCYIYNHHGFFVYINSNNDILILTLYYNGGSNTITFDAGSMSTLNYYRVVIGVSGTTPFAYLNGAFLPIISGSTDSGLVSTSANFQIGILAGEYTPCDGFIGNVQLWNAAFDADDVEYDYLNCYQNLTADNRPGTSLTPANLKGHWPLIEGSGDVAYDWSGNGNHGTLTNFPTDDSQWSNASALDSPLAIQTALCEWALKDSNNACVPLDTADSTNFTRDYSELNWNGRSFIDKLTGADATTSGTYTLEAVLNIDDVTALQYILDGQHNTGTGYVKQTAGTIAVSSGTVYVDGVATTTITAGLCHVVVSGITLTADELWLINKYTNDNRLTGQLAMLKLYAETWDAAKVTKAYAKAKAKYNL